MGLTESNVFFAVYILFMLMEFCQNLPQNVDKRSGGGYALVRLSEDWEFDMFAV